MSSSNHPFSVDMLVIVKRWTLQDEPWLNMSGFTSDHFCCGLDSLKAVRKGLWVGKKSHSMRLGFCSRSKDIIEPYLKPQWWMNCQDLADRSVTQLKEKVRGRPFQRFVWPMRRKVEEQEFCWRVQEDSSGFSVVELWVFVQCCFALVLDANWY